MVDVSKLLSLHFLYSQKPDHLPVANIPVSDGYDISIWWTMFEFHIFYQQFRMKKGVGNTSIHLYIYLHV